MVLTRRWEVNGHTRPSTRSLFAVLVIAYSVLAMLDCGLRLALGSGRRADTMFHEETANTEPCGKLLVRDRSTASLVFADRSIVEIQKLGQLGLAETSSKP